MPESVVKHYYDQLRAGKLAARKCQVCHGYTFPPTTACEHCGSADLEWVELSGKASLLFVSNGIAPPPNPMYNDLAPYAYGHVALAEGIYVQAIITGIRADPAELNQYFEKGPVDVVPDIIEVKGLPVLAFKTV